MALWLRLRSPVRVSKLLGMGAPGRELVGAIDDTVDAPYHPSQVAGDLLHGLLVLLVSFPSASPGSDFSHQRIKSTPKLGSLQDALRDLSSLREFRHVLEDGIFNVVAAVHFHLFQGFRALLGGEPLPWSPG